MEGYIIKSISHLNGFKITNYQPNIDTEQMNKTKIGIIKKLQLIFPMTRSQLTHK